MVAHEWGHILDFQKLDNGETVEFLHYRDETSRRRIRHDDRPHEIRADEYVRVAQRRIAIGELSSCDDATLDLAVWLEEGKHNGMQMRYGLGCTQ